MMPGHPNGFVSVDHCGFCATYEKYSRYRSLVDGNADQPLVVALSNAFIEGRSSSRARRALWV